MPQTRRNSDRWAGETGRGGSWFRTTVRGRGAGTGPGCVPSQAATAPPRLLLHPKTSVRPSRDHCTRTPRSRCPMTSLCPGPSTGPPGAPRRWGLASGQGLVAPCRVCDVAEGLRPWPSSWGGRWWPDPHAEGPQKDTHCGADPIPPLPVSGCRPRLSLEWPPFYGCTHGPGTATRQTPRGQHKWPGPSRPARQACVLNQDRHHPGRPGAQGPGLHWPSVLAGLRPRKGNEGVGAEAEGGDWPRSPGAEPGSGAGRAAGQGGQQGRVGRAAVLLGQQAQGAHSCSGPTGWGADRGGGGGGRCGGGPMPHSRVQCQQPGPGQQEGQGVGEKGAPVGAHRA